MAPNVHATIDVPTTDKCGKCVHVDACLMSTNMSRALLSLGNISPTVEIFAANKMRTRYAKGHAVDDSIKTMATTTPTTKFTLFDSNRRIVFLNIIQLVTYCFVNIARKHECCHKKALFLVHYNFGFFVHAMLDAELTRKPRPPKFNTPS